MIEVALVRNPYSTRNRRASGTGLALGSLARQVRLVDCARLEELSDRLREARAAGARVLLVDGGDGTVREVLSRLPAIWGPELPEIGILPRGNTNVIARQAGAIRSPDAVGEVLRRRARGAPMRRRRLTLLKLDYPAGEGTPMRGFIVGWGAYATATRIAREEIRVVGRGQVPLAVASTVRRALFGRESAAMRTGVSATLVADGAPVQPGRRLIGLATTLEGSLVAGINPFWGDGPGRLRWLDVQAPGRWLLAALPFVVRGAGRRWMTRAGYRSGRAMRLELTLDTPFVMDGDFFPAPERGPLVMSAGEEVTFLSL